MRSDTSLAKTAILLAGGALSLVAGAPGARAQTYVGDAQGSAAPLSGGTAQQASAVTPTAQPSYQPVRASVSMPAGSGRVIHLPAPAINVFTADPKVAEVRPASANSLFVFGVGPGETTVAALGANGEPIGHYQVSVMPSAYNADNARGAIARGGRAAITTRSTEAGVGLSGHAVNAGEADRAVSAAKTALPADGKVDNRLTVSEPIQVGLHVRIAEMSRSLSRALGVNWTAVAELGKEAAISAATKNFVLPITGVNPTEATVGIGRSGTGLPNLSATIDALSQDQLVHVLAEPNLVAMSGQPASFLVGGEFPIPVATGNNTVSLEFKQYGISLAFVPTVVAHDRISLHVRPEVSALDKANGVTSFVNQNLAVSIPALTVRRADTTVELGSGQSFAIAGLLSDQTSQVTQATPGLGDIPILGALFRSDTFQRQESELVIVVTPYIVRPVSDPAALHLSSDGYHPPNDLERILQLRQLGRGSTQAYGRIPADAGFIIE